MNLSALIQQQYLVSTYANRGLTLVKGDKQYLYDELGNKYLDMMSNFGVNLLGHSNTNIQAKLVQQIQNLTTLHSSFNNNIRSQALKLLKQNFTTSGVKNLDRFYFSSSGAEAIEAALKFAIIATEKHKFLSVGNDYHGKTLAALSTTTSADGKYQKPFKNILLDVDVVPANDVETLKNTIHNNKSTYAGLILEPIQGEGGIIKLNLEYLLEVSKLCQANKILLIVDEIQTGCYRTGTFLNIEQAIKKNFICDILCLAKGIAGGIPAGITAITNTINTKLPKGIQTSTFGGNPLAMAGIVATLEELNNINLTDNVSVIGNYFLDNLKQQQKQYPDQITECRGEGLMIGMELQNDVIELVKFLQKNYILAAPTSTNTVRFLPPLIIDKKDIDIVGEVLNKYLEMK